MSGYEEIEGEVVAEYDEPGTDLERVQPAASPMTLFGTDNPRLVLEKATETADALAAVIEDKKLYTVIKQKRHIHVEGWTLLGSMLGVFAEVEWSRQTTDSYGKDAWEARAVARTMSGAVVGAREAMCSRAEPKWKDRDDYALKSMAQTRAISGALASPLRFIVVLAGFSGTPEAEMPREAHGEVRQESAGRPVGAPRSGAEVKARMEELLGEDEAAAWGKQAKDAAESLPPPSFFQRMQGVVIDLIEGGEWQLRTDAREAVQAVFAARLDGLILPGPDWALTGAEAEAGTPSKEEVLSREGAA